MKLRAVFLEKMKIDKPLARLSRKKKRTQKKLEMKKEMLQLIPQKYKGSYKTTMSNYSSQNE